MLSVAGHALCCATGIQLPPCHPHAGVPGLRQGASCLSPLLLLHDSQLAASDLLCALSASTAKKSQIPLLQNLQATVFAQEMGTAMHDVPVFGTNFNTWFPLVVVVYCTLL